MNAFIDSCFTTMSEGAATSEDSWQEEGSYVAEDPRLSDTHSQPERGTYSVSSSTPSRTKRGHSPAPKFLPSYNFHVNVGFRGRQDVRYRD